MKRNLICVLIVAIAATACGPQNQPEHSSDTGTPGSTGIPATSPSIEDYKAIFPDEGRQGWPTPYLWQAAPKLVVEKWLTEEPQTEGRFVLLDFWATWCTPCLRMIPTLNQLQEEYGDQLVIIGLSEETEEEVRQFREPAILYSVAIDTKKHLQGEYAVAGLPYGVLIEPGGTVVYQGYGLDEEIVRNVLSVASGKPYSLLE